MRLQMRTTLSAFGLVLFGACLCKSSSTFTVWQTQAQVVFGLTNPLNVLQKLFHVSLSYRGFAIHCTCVKSVAYRFTSENQWIQKIVQTFSDAHINTQRKRKKMHGLCPEGQ